ncbi:hypothetical protein E4K10_46365 [Streptomyces sp. T1317-0309]|nr:hypothetical protein E4K10_46365 [Streptomyces sp. T1317-0309]
MRAFIGRHRYSGGTRPDVLVGQLGRHLTTAAPGTTSGKQATAVLVAEQLALLNDHIRILKRIVVAFAEDASQVCTGMGPRAMTTHA